MNAEVQNEPPHSKEAEMLVLGCALTSINSLNTAAERLEEGDFYFAEHKIIFRCLKEFYKADKEVDVHLASLELKRQDMLTPIGGPVYLVQLAQYAGVSYHIDEYVEVVKSKSILRKMASSARSIEKIAMDEPADAIGALEEAQQILFRIGQAKNAKAGELIGDILAGKTPSSKVPFLKELEMRQERYMRLGPTESTITGIPTGLIDLDKMINGFVNSNLIVLASRPAMGKTALALNIAEHIAFKRNVPVGIFSLEMNTLQLVHRVICSQSGVESNKIITGTLSPQEYQFIVEAVQEVEKHNVIIDDQPYVKVTDLMSRARRMKEGHKVGCIIIDYLQLLSGSGYAKSTENRQNEISEISRMLKILAKELDIPILCLAQLSRKAEDRSGHRPLMSDLRESGSIEQDADIVMFLLRREYYDAADRPGQAEIIVAKNRHGETGSVTLTYRKEIGQFANFCPMAYVQPQG